MKAYQGIRYRDDVDLAMAERRIVTSAVEGAPTRVLAPRRPRRPNRRAARRMPPTLRSKKSIDPSLWIWIRRSPNCSPSSLCLKDATKGRSGNTLATISIR